MILTKELTQTLSEITALSTCTEAGESLIYMQGTDVKSEIQYMSAINVLRTCYDLLYEAGFKVQKDETDQSLTIWGLKLKFVTMVNGYRVNINAPDINYTFNYSMRLDHTTFTKTNYFLQRSEISGSGLLNSGGSGLFGDECTGASSKICPGYNKSMLFTDNYREDDVSKYTVLLTLYCSSDGIQICYKTWKKDTDRYSDLKPLLSIYKGKNRLNNKNILIVGQMLEKAPFAFDYGVMTNSSNTLLKSFYCASYSNVSNTYNNNYLWHPFASAYVCSGSNLIYEYDEENSKWTKTDETLYLDAEEYIGDTKISLQLLDGVATGNFGKYEIYGIAKVKEKLIGFIPNSFYEINDKKYWCRYGNLQTSEADNNYKINLNLNANDVINITANNNSKYMFALTGKYGAMLLLKSKYNSFGCGAIVPPTTSAEYKDLCANNPYFETYSECKPSPDCLNPYIFLRIDDVIVDN